jgi:quercetin dioxygenase-like cupin family protein
MEKKAFDSLKTFSVNSFVRKRDLANGYTPLQMYCFEPGQQNSLHRHPVSDEIVCCYGG